MSKIDLNALLKASGVENDDTGAPIEGEQGDVGADPVVVEDEFTDEERVALEEADLAAEELPAEEAQIDADTNDVEELGEVQDALESIANDIEGSLAEGGLQPQAAQYLSHALESHYNNLGETVERPSLESFGGFSSRLTASQEAFEGVVATIKKIWEAIKALAKKVWDTVTGFLKRIFTAAGRLKASAEALAKRAESISGNTEAVSVGGVGSKVALGSKIEVTGLEKIRAVLEQSLSWDKSAQELLDKDFEGLQKLATTQIEDDDARMEALLKQSLSQGQRIAPATFRNRDESNGKLRWSTDLLPGNVRFTLAYDNADEVDGRFGKIVAKYFKGWRVDKDVKETEVNVEKKTFSSAELKKIASEALAIVKLSEAAADRAASQKHTFKDFKIAEGISKGQAAAVKLLMRDYSKRVAMSYQCTAKVSAYAVSTAGNFVSLATRAAKATKGKGEAKKDEGKKAA